MSDPRNVLQAAYQSVEREFIRIENLLSPEESNPLGDYADVIAGKFNEPLSKIRNTLADLESAIKEGKFSEGWRDYTTIRSTLMPMLSSELLAVIGGVYLIEKHLDDAKAPSVAFDGGNEASRSFSRIARRLVDDLNRSSGGGWQSVLIVGEERLTYSTAEIIRLRFPACDIWNLPFTAHEYGYLLAHKTTAPNRFRDLRDKVRLNVHPAYHRDSATGELLKPQDEACFLEDVRKFWDVCYQLDYKDCRDAFDAYLAEQEDRIDQLQDLQSAHLCRLFADAFATYFVGPAYVHALLHLLFLPDETLYRSSSSIPSFTERFVVAMETLKFMHAKDFRSSDTGEKFLRETNDTAGIPALWKSTLQSAGAEDRYDEVLTKYRPWLDAVKDALQAHYNSIRSIGTTFRNWQGARELEKKMIEPGRTEGSFPMWAVVNAAWTARWMHPQSVDIIEYKALQLLDPGQQEPTYGRFAIRHGADRSPAPPPRT